VQLMLNDHVGKTEDIVPSDLREAHATERIGHEKWPCKW
jgi:hypothetical protein